MFCFSCCRINRLIHHLMIQEGSMKPAKAAFITLTFLFCWMVNGYADRLYTWTDAQGVTHITQDPPPAAAKSVDTIDYLPQPNPPVRRPTANDLTNQQPGNPDQGEGQSGRDSGAGLTSADETKDIQYDGDSYRRTLLRYEIKHKILDEHKSGKDGPHPRNR
jgi:Domain of unknown function (DUF4124)